MTGLFSIRTRWTAAAVPLLVFSLACLWGFV